MDSRTLQLQKRIRVSRTIPADADVFCEIVNDYERQIAKLGEIVDGCERRLDAMRRALAEFGKETEADDNPTGA